VPSGRNTISVEVKLDQARLDAMKEALTNFNLVFQQFARTMAPFIIAVNKIMTDYQHRIEQLDQARDARERDAAQSHAANLFAVRRLTTCDRCNYDVHTCPGCGEPLPHGMEVCDELYKALNNGKIGCVEQARIDERPDLDAAEVGMSPEAVAEAGRVDDAYGHPGGICNDGADEPL